MYIKRFAQKCQYNCENLTQCVSGLTAKISTKCLHHRPYIWDFFCKFKANFFNYICRQIFIPICTCTFNLFILSRIVLSKVSFSDLLGNCPNFSYKEYKSKSKWLCFYYLFKCQKKQERNQITGHLSLQEVNLQLKHKQTSFENALLFQSIYKVHRKSIQTLRKSIHLCTVQQT